VTRARGGHSNHNFGIAWDIGIFENGTYKGASRKYAEAARVGLVPGLEWGGHWTSFKDEPHYQLATGSAIAAVRTSFESGTAYV
jgi:peptidoglycan L-alanyl-D-glutamate endopeptidase CwlK